MQTATTQFADALQQYQSAKADVDAIQFPDIDDTNAEIVSALRRDFDAKVHTCHEAAIALAKAPVSNLKDLLTKVRVMVDNELDLTPAREGAAYAEILTDLEALAC